MADKYISLSRLSTIANWVKDKLSDKQDILTAGDNITINNNTISADDEVFVAVYDQTSYTDVKAAIDAHKAIVLDMPANNNQFCVTFSTYTNGGDALMYAIYKMNNKPTLMTITLTTTSTWTISHTDLQDKLESGTNIKTINNTSLLGSGNIDIQGGGSAVFIAIAGTTTYLDLANAIDTNKVIYIKPSSGSIPHIVSRAVKYDGDKIQLYVEWYFDSQYSPYSDSRIYGYEYTVTTNNVWGRKGKETSTVIPIVDQTYSSSSANAQSGVAVAEGIAAIANPNESVEFNANGQLTVGGRLGQYTNGGVYYPVDIEPTNVGSSSFLMTDGAKNIDIKMRTFAIMAGANITCKSTPAGSTTYRVSNTQSNRFALAAVKGGRAALNQTDATTNGTASIVSIKYANGNDLTAPYFGANESSNDIIITLNKTINPNAATTQIRVYGTNVTGDNILAGQGVGAGGGKVISLGQSTYAGGNQNIAFGNSVYVNQNNSVGLGHTMLINKQYCFGAGQGHDFTNGSNGTAAVGTWSQIIGSTKFAVGNGTAYDSRSNIFEVRDNAGATEVVMKSPNGTKYKLTIDNDGTVKTVLA